MPPNDRQFFTGVKELDKALSDLPVSLQKKAARKATREAAKVVRDEAVALAPHDTGLLEQSLKVRAKARSTTREGRKNKVGHTVLTTRGLFKGQAFYGGFLEFGTGPRQAEGGANRGLIPDLTFSFLRPALYSNRAAKFAIFLREFRRWVTKLK